jgi:predicted acyl esterase
MQKYFMGLFNNIFKSNKEEQVVNESNINWIPFNSLHQLEEIKELSKQETILIFKHSTRCGISRMVIKMFEKQFDYLRNYKLDEAAQIDIRYDLTFEWFDYILKGKKKPSILKDKVNFQVMDTDTWMHKSSLSAMTNDTLKLHLSEIKKGDFYSLTDKSKTSKVDLLVDFKDRKTMNNTEYYPWPLEREKINLKDGLTFQSDVLEKDVIINGSFLGDLEFTINKKDVDFSVILYQLTPEGKYFHLSYYIGRASYAKSREKRELLKQHQLNKVHFENSKLISKKLTKGSRIVAVVNVNKNFNSQINYGTGKDVNTESIKDADVPLKITFTGNSSISIPIWRK